MFLMISRLFGEIPQVFMECSIFNLNWHVSRSALGSGTIKSLGTYMIEPNMFGMMCCKHKLLMILPPPVLLSVSRIRVLLAMFPRLAWKRTSGDKKRLSNTFLVKKKKVILNLSSVGNKKNIIPNLKGVGPWGGGLG